MFLAEMPDMNWRNPELRQAMFDVARTWLARGVDGFRMDVGLYVMKAPGVRDNPPAADGELTFHKSFKAWDEQLHVNDHAHPDAHEVWREFRALLDAAAPPDRVAIAEVHLFAPVEWASWFGTALDEFHLPFNFSLLQAPWDAGAIAETVSAFEHALPDGAWPNWVLGNHDEPRVASRVGLEAARAAMMLLLTLRGTPTLYYGDELGLPDVALPPELMRDPQARLDPALSRDPQRSPMPWSPGPGHGFTVPDAVPWLPAAPEADALSVQRQAGDPRSMLSLTRALLPPRAASPALSTDGALAVPAGTAITGPAARSWARVPPSIRSSSGNVTASPARSKWRETTSPTAPARPARWAMAWAGPVSDRLGGRPTPTTTAPS